MSMQVRFLSRCVVLLALAALAGCPAMPPRPAELPVDDAAEAKRLVERGRHAEAADLYARAADRSAGVEAGRFRTLAAEAAWEAGDVDTARRQLARVDVREFDPDTALRAQLLGAHIALHDRRPGEALSRLPSEPHLLARPFAARALLVRAEANVALGYARDAVIDLVARERHLDTRADVDDNRQRIWRALRRLDTVELDGDEPVLDGWFALAELRRRAWQDPWTFDDALGTWRHTYPGHPATAQFLPRLVEEQRRLAEGVRQYALLLPLSGRFESAAAAVRDGFLAAHFRGPDPARRALVRIYDTGDEPEMAVQKYYQAVQEGADFVIGPLQKDSVASLARVLDLPVPVLALNTLDHQHAPLNMFQFGLVPENEAEQIAERAALEGHLRAVALIPDSDLGLRMLHAFTERFEQQGGTVVAAQLFDPQQRDHSAPIVRALAIDESRSRHQMLRTVLNVPLQAEPRRRRDADFVFLVANAQQGRSLRPQLRFHHASDLPVYASSLLYGGWPDRAGDADLNGVAFTDMPWVLAPDPATAAVKEELAEHLGASLERNSRFFAFGYDAYRLAPVLRHDPSLLQESLPAATGALRLDEGARIHRTLTWARFRGGLAQPLQAPLVVPTVGDPDAEDVAVP